MPEEPAELTLLLVRHGETDWNAQRRWQGQRDVALNETGRQQAHLLRDRLRTNYLTGTPYLPGPPTHFFSSPLSRARETADILSGAFSHLVPLTEIPDLRERSFGKWEGMTMEEIHAAYGKDAENDTRESWDSVGERMLNALTRIRETVPHGVAMVVGHGGSLRFLLTHALGASQDSAPNFRLDNTGLSIAVYFDHPHKGAIGRLQLVNDTSHLW